MTCDEFSEAYWAHYISLEKEFLKTTTYVSLGCNNNKTYSDAFLKLLLAIGSEVDVTMKFFCRLLDSTFSGNSIEHYRSCIEEHRPTYFDQEVSVREGLMNIKPWANRNSKNKVISPFWWNAYNKCKHNRTEVGEINGERKEYYKFANLEYTLAALGGLYQTILYSYRILADSEGKRIVIPLPGSRLFKLIGPDWNNVEFFYDFAFYLNPDNGTLNMECSNIHY